MKLYRYQHDKDLKQLNDLIAKGYDVEEATQVLPFDNMLPDFKAALYIAAATKYKNLLDLEAAFQVKWLELRGEKVQVTGLPNVFEYMLPYDEYPAEGQFTWLTLNERQDEPKAVGLLIDRVNDQYPIISGSFPDTLLQDVGKLSDMGVHTDNLQIFLAQMWYQRTKQVYRFNNDELLEQIKAKANIVAFASPASKAGTRALSVQRGLLRKVFGTNINSYLLKLIIKEVKEPEFEVASNAAVPTERVRVAAEKGNTVIDFDLDDFVTFLLDKLRPHGTGKGTVPFNIPEITLLSAYLWETAKKTPHPNIKNLPSRKELVSLMNTIHASRYYTWLGDRKNSPELAELYFECAGHPSSTDAQLERGRKWLKSHTKTTLPTTSAFTM